MSDTTYSLNISKANGAENENLSVTTTNSEKIRDIINKYKQLCSDQPQQPNVIDISGGIVQMPVATENMDFRDNEVKDPTDVDYDDSVSKYGRRGHSKKANMQANNQGDNALPMPEDEMFESLSKDWATFKKQSIKEIFKSSQQKVDDALDAHDRKKDKAKKDLEDKAIKKQHDRNPFSSMIPGHLARKPDKKVKEDLDMELDGPELPGLGSDSPIGSPMSAPKKHSFDLPGSGPKLGNPLDDLSSGPKLGMSKPTMPPMSNPLAPNMDSMNVAGPLKSCEDLVEILPHLAGKYQSKDVVGGSSIVYVAFGSEQKRKSAESKLKNMGFDVRPNTYPGSALSEINVKADMTFESIRWKKKEVNEVSKNKLGKYIKKATRDSTTNAWRSGAASTSKVDGKRADKLMSKADSRDEGIDAAVNKLTGKAKVPASESKLDEVSKKKLARYISSASFEKDSLQKNKDRRDRFYPNANIEREIEEPILNRRKKGIDDAVNKSIGKAKVKATESKLREEGEANYNFRRQQGANTQTEGPFSVRINPDVVQVYMNNKMIASYNTTLKDAFMNMWNATTGKLRLRDTENFLKRYGQKKSSEQIGLQSDRSWRRIPGVDKD